MKTALLFLNGEPPKNFIVKTYDTIGCTDGAYHYAKNLPIKLDFVLGDFDSVNPNEIENIEVIVKPDQNFTDFEKAIQYLIEKKINSIEIWGGSGKEEDHFLGNISVLVQYHKKIEMIFHTDTHYFFMAKKENNFRVEKNKIISLFPLNHVKEITTSGLEFPLKNESLKIGKRIGVRNKSINKQIKITLKKGKLLTIVEK